MKATALNVGIYYQGMYWNDYAIVRDELNRRATGHATTTWHEHFSALTQPKFRKALILNCGNGWVERDMFDRGMFHEAVAFDASANLLTQAEDNRGERPIQYRRIDANEISLEALGRGYDLVVNYAACHHVGRLFKFMKIIAQALVPTGIMVNWDYVGPDRNQYPYEMWEQVSYCNDRLPTAARANLIYPHLPTMLATDPSEAIRSSYILPAFHQYFNISYQAMLGGAIAYPLITHNSALAKMDISQSRPIIEHLISEDEVWCKIHPEHNLFSYWWGTPRLSTDTSGSEVREEHEAAWFQTHSVTFPAQELTLLQRLTQQISDLQLACAKN